MSTSWSPTRSCCAKVSGMPSWSDFATDAGWLQTAGFDCVVCGPGDIALAHKPNESIGMAEFHAADRFLEELIAHATGAEPA